jgi:hypothetical protein
VQRRAALVVLLVHVRAALEQVLNHGAVAEAAGLVQSRVAVTVACRYREGISVVLSGMVFIVNGSESLVSVLTKRNLALTRNTFDAFSRK